MTSTRLVLALVMLVGSLITGAMPARAADDLPQVNSSQLSSGETVLDWGSRYQVNVCDSRQAWTSMTLWVRPAGSRTWRKVGTDPAVGKTSTWAVRPAKCDYMANFAWTVDVPRKRFGEVTFAYGQDKPTYRFSAVVANPLVDPGRAPAPAPQPAAPSDSIPISAFANGQRGLVVETPYDLWSCSATSASTRLFLKDFFGSWNLLAMSSTPSRSGSCPAERPWISTFGSVTMPLGSGQLEGGNTVVHLATGDSSPTNRFTAPVFLSADLCRLAGFTC